MQDKHYTSPNKGIKNGYSGGKLAMETWLLSCGFLAVCITNLKRHKDALSDNPGPGRPSTRDTIEPGTGKSHRGAFWEA